MIILLMVAALKILEKFCPKFFKFIFYNFPHSIFL